jgi:hypothetical protein
MRFTLLFQIGFLTVIGSALGSPPPSSGDSPDTMIVEDFGVKEYHFTPGRLRWFGLTPESTREDVRKTLARFGVHLAPEDAVTLWKNGSLLLVKSHTDKWKQIDDLLARCDAEMKRR